MTEKRFKVHAEEYQDTDDMGYAIAPPVLYYHVGNSKIGFNFDTEKEAKMLCEAWNKLVEENEQSKMMIATLRNMVLDQEDLEKENKELKTFKDKVFALIDARIEIYKHKPFMAPVSAPLSVNFDEDTDRLARLSELEQLKEEYSE